MQNPETRPATVAGPVTENSHAIRQLADLLAVLPGKRYRQAFGARQQHILGKHVRHIIDHYLSFIGAVSLSSIAPLNYENRQREEDLERDNHAARDRLLAVAGSLEQLARTPASTRLPMVHVSDDERVVMDTTVGRELVFLASHTIHHMAIVAMLAEQAGVSVPEDFGVQPSTLRYQRRQHTTMAKSA